MSSNNPPPLPDVSQWQPRTDASENLSTAFMKRCLASEERILLQSRHERDMTIDNYDSGSGVEDIIREELSQLLPNRYATKAGVLNDSFGQTGGDYDIVIFNSQWIPEIKAGATISSRRIHLPIEGVYAVGEVTANSLRGDFCVYRNHSRRNPITNAGGYSIRLRLTPLGIMRFFHRLNIREFVPFHFG